MRQTSFFAAALAATAQAAQDSRTFAVLRFYGDGPLMEGRVDPIVSPGVASGHVHTIQGGSNMGVSATGEDLMNSNCSSALVEGDNSAYWFPKLYFHDKDNGTVEPVDLYYANIYYFFEPTDDDVVAFPTGLQITSGDASLRDCPNFYGSLQLDAGNSSGIQSVQWTCPRSSYEPASWEWASVSDGSTAGIQDQGNQGAGQGFPFAECDGEYSPLRQDTHFPSCYDPSKDLTDYKNNMVFPTTNYTTGKQNCPAGFIHVPHLFFESYWNTPVFADRWTPQTGYQPFVLSNGDLSGCSSHGDFMAAWDTTVLQNIIDTCDAGDSGMDQCPGVTVRDRSSTCNVASPIVEDIYNDLSALPGNNPLTGWGMSFGGSGAATSVASVASSAASSASGVVSSALSALTASSETEPSAPTSSAASVAVGAASFLTSLTTTNPASPAETGSSIDDSSSLAVTTTAISAADAAIPTETATSTASAAATTLIKQCKKRRDNSHDHAEAHIARHQGSGAGSHHFH